MSDRTRIQELIEKSSLGTRSAQAARHSVPVEKGRAIVRAAAARAAISTPRKKPAT